MTEHWSDCATNNGPALDPGACDCGGVMSWKPIETLPELTAGQTVDLWAVDERGNGRRWVNCYKSKWGWIYADAYPKAGGYALEAKPTHWMWAPPPPKQTVFKCPINYAGCVVFCGNYGCGG